MGSWSCRLVSTTNDVSWVPGSGAYPFDPFWSFYDRAWPASREPDYLKNETTVRVQTNLYSVDGGRLLWTGISDSFLAADARERSKRFAGELVRKWKLRGCCGELTSRFRRCRLPTGWRIALTYLIDSQNRQRPGAWDSRTAVLSGHSLRRIGALPDFSSCQPASECD